MTVAFAHVTFDAVDAKKLADFWSGALGQSVDEGAEVWFASINFRPGGGPGPAWLFTQVPEAKTAKNRMHLDLVCEERVTEADRLVALGATKANEVDEWGHQWIVMHDPEGNEFCISNAH
jgi:catechol 2,3-dioxygenase-like lactoylglutathione lyase family enzyme